jgi:hypothetical protein
MIEKTVQVAQYALYWPADLCLPLSPPPVPSQGAAMPRECIPLKPLGTRRQLQTHGTREILKCVSKRDNINRYKLRRKKIIERNPTRIQWK